MSKISLFQDIARKLGESNPYRKASKYGMAPGNMSGQANQVASNRATYIRQHNRMIDDMKSDLEDQMDLKGFSLDAIVEGLRKQGYSDKDIMQYIMNIKVQK